MDYFELLLFKNYLKHLNAYSNSFTIVNIIEKFNHKTNGPSIIKSVHKQ